MFPVKFRYLRKYKKVNDNNMQVETLELQSEKNRKRLVEIVFKSTAGQIGGDLSCLNVLTALYFDIMRVWPDNQRKRKEIVL